MIVDTSAILSLIRREPEAAAVLSRLTAPGPKRMSTATASELFAVVTRNVTPGGWSAVTQLLETLDIELVPYDVQHLASFRHAYATYGRGGHNTSKARLNLGDCFAYALAATLGEPLLFVGNDFSHTDVVPAL